METKMKTRGKPFTKGVSRPNFKGHKHSQESKLKISINCKKAGCGKSNIGRKLTEETKIKISNKLKGHKPWSKGLKHTKETIEKLKKIAKEKWNKEIETKLRNSHLGKPSWNKGKKMLQISGKNHYNWKNGITILDKQIRNSFEYRQWRSDIFTRDDFRCSYCNQKGGRLQVHHIIPLSQMINKYKIKIFSEALLYEELWNINNGITLCVECHKKTDTYAGRSK